MKYAVAKAEKGQPRFFTGRYVAGASLALMSPVTSAQPDQAKEYPDKAVAEVVVALLNVGVVCATGENSQPWIVMQLPDAWL
jgi:hypothetical protein